MGIRLIRLIKRNPLTVHTFNKILDYQCRNVKVYIFVATTGRSGSVTLSKVFEAVDKAVCFHEPHPIMNNDYPPGTDKLTYFNELFYNLKKIYVKRNARDYSYYIETNHQFVKNFISQAIECFSDKIRIIHLVRDPIKVASSFYQIDSIPGKTLRGKHYLIDPRGEDNLIKISDLLYNSIEFVHDLYKNLWYWYEVETRIKVAKQKYPHVFFYKLRTEDLNKEDAILDMFKKLDIHVEHSKLKPLIGSRANTRLEEKVKDVNIEECKLMNVKLLKEMEKRYGKNFWL